MSSCVRGEPAYSLDYQSESREGTSPPPEDCSTSTTLLRPFHTPSFVFFFQAEDGIRDPLVTGVQTCALPISNRCRRCGRGMHLGASRALAPGGPVRAFVPISCGKSVAPRGRDSVARSVRRRAATASQDDFDVRSEERRVGKECRSRWWRYL